jgi:hypothetical protein
MEMNCVDLKISGHRLARRDCNCTHSGNWEHPHGRNNALGQVTQDFVFPAVYRASRHCERSPQQRLCTQGECALRK